jgi:hypothetical protein
MEPNWSRLILDDIQALTVALIEAGAIKKDALPPATLQRINHRRQQLQQQPI